MNSRLTIQDLAGLLAEYTGKDKSTTERFLREFIAVVSEGVYADKIVKVKGLGTFKIIPVEKRESIHVNTGERFVIPEHYKFSFLPDKELRELVNKPFSFFETTEVEENVDFTDLDIVADEPEEKETEDESVEEVMPEEERLPKEENAQEEEPVIAPEEPVEQPEDIEEEIPLPLEDAPVETEPEPIQPLSFSVPEAGKPKPTRTKWIAALSVFALFLVAFNLCLYLNRNHFFDGEKEAPVLKKDTVSSKENNSWLLYPEEVEKRSGVAESGSPEATGETESARQDTIPSPTADVKPEPVAQEVIARVKIEPGSRLTLISLKYYGSKIFWVYLYEYNKAIIKDPNNVPIGTVIKVPSPELYGIDRRNRSSVEKAAARQTEILNGKL